LARLDEGSAGPVGVVVFLAAQLAGAEGEPECDYIKEAPTALFHAIEAVNNGSNPTEYLPQHVLSYFDRFGRSLRDDEAVEFTIAGSDTPVCFDQRSRHRLIQRSAAREQSDEVRLRGRICEADQHKHSFNLMLHDGTRLPASLPASQLESVLEAFKGFREGVYVELRGVAWKDASGRVIRIEEVHHIDLLDPLDVGLQLDELRALGDGWLDGKGSAPTAEGVDWLTEWFERRVPPSAAPPRFYPTAEGGVRAEGMFGRQDVSLDIDLAARRGQWHRLNLDSDDDEEERSLNLDTDDAIWLVERLRQLEGGQRA